MNYLDVPNATPKRVADEEGLNWASSRLGSNVAHIRFHHRFMVGDEKATPEKRKATLRWFMNRLNRKVYGKAHRRYGKELTYTVGEHSDGGNHFHLNVQIPNDRMSFLRFRSLVTLIAFKTSWIERKYGYPRIYCEVAKNVNRSVRYAVGNQFDNAVL